MNILYKKDKLYVYLDSIDKVDESLAKRISDIMDYYQIEDLVIDANGLSSEHIHKFARDYNYRHKTNIIIKN